MSLWWELGATSLGNKTSCCRFRSYSTLSGFWTWVLWAIIVADLQRIGSAHLRHLTVLKKCKCRPYNFFVQVTQLEDHYWGSGFHHRLSVCLFFCTISNKSATRIIIEVFHHDCCKLIYFGVKRSRSWSTKTASVGFFAFLWVLAFLVYYCWWFL